MSQRLSWPAVGLWTALTLVGVAAGVFFHFPGDAGSLRWSAVEFNWFGGLVGFLFGAVSGLVITLLQAQVLLVWARPVAWAWIVYGTLGYGLVHALGDAVPFRPLAVLGGGLLVAFAQTLALRPVLARPGWWLPVSAGAWWVGFGLAAGMQGDRPLIGGLVVALATGLALRWLLVPTAGPAPLGLPSHPAEGLSRR
jgi:hypothetical protein